MSTHDSASAGVFLVGIYEGVLPLVSKVFDWHPFLAFPLRLPNPWWWIVSVAVIIVAVIALDAIDKAKKRAA
ncbi:hypothetical protein [Actinokineospora sp. HUAS TT18]|uniref:hypothetical protein n=1 Tax=Actinokineospora sp. HUAS TT18 TaxID=3447451 RepID=UPI003F51FC7E